MLFFKKKEPFNLSNAKIFEEITNYLCIHKPEYSRVMGEHRIEKTGTEYSFCFSFCVFSYYKEYVYEPYAYIVNHQIEEIEAQALHRKSSPEDITIGGKLSNLFKYEFILGKDIDIRFSVTSRKSLEKIKKKLLKLLHRAEKEYFEKFCSLEMIHLGLNKYPNAYSVHRQIDVYGRYRTGIIAAKLVNAPNFNELVEIYKAEILNAEQFDELKKFEFCVEYMNINY